VWIMGSSIIYWAQRRACIRPVGSDLGLAAQGVEVRWHGVRGLRFGQVKSEIYKLLSDQPKPSVILIHAGANDLGLIKGVQIINIIKETIDWVVEQLPGVVIIWSDMLCRLVWREAKSVQAMERARKKINRDVEKYVLLKGGRVCRHVDIDYTCPGLFRPQDGVHLSDIGSDIFLNDLQSSMELFIKSEEKVFPREGY
jgi:lysophospholipase L1-like esterase